MRILPGAGDRAIGSIIINQAPFAVLNCLCDALAERTRSLNPDVIVGLPTLGLAIAPEIARRLRLTNFVALGYSRKFWYTDRLSADVTSITSPGHTKRLNLDPNLISRLERRRAVLVDDVVARGTTLSTARQLLAPVADVIGAVTVMAQTEAWQKVLTGFELRSVFRTPLFERRSNGWWPIPG